MLKATVYGLSTEGYAIAGACVRSGVETSVIDESLGVSMRLKDDVVRNFPSAEALSKESLLTLEPAEKSLEDADVIFFTPRVRREWEEFRGEVSLRIREAVKRLSTNAVFCYNLPTSIGGNAEVVEIIEKMSGLSSEKDFRYIYAPIPPQAEKISYVGCSSSKIDKELSQVLRAAYGKNPIFSSVEATELLYAKDLLDSHTKIASAFETGREMIRQMPDSPLKLTGTQDVFIDNLVAGLLDLKLLSSSFRGGDPLLHIASGVLKSLDGYVKHLAEHIRDQIRKKQFKAAKTRVFIYWDIDHFEMRGDKLQTLLRLQERLRDFVNEIYVTPTGGSASPQRLSGVSSAEGKTGILVACSRRDFKSAQDALARTGDQGGDLVIRANLTFEEWIPPEAPRRPTRSRARSN